MEGFNQGTMAKNDSLLVGNIRGRDFKSLLPDKWLKDSIINMFFGLLEVEGGIHCFSPFFVTKLLNHGHETKPDEYGYERVKRWTRNIDVFVLKKAFVPINLGLSHWILALIDFQEKKIQLYDSYRKKMRPRPNLLEGLLRYLKDEHQNKKGRPMDDEDSWNLIDVQINETPHQVGDNDCGVFICIFAYLLSKGRPLDFTQADITATGRQFVGISILQNKTI